jgi:L-cystine transport system ATP-binding protein
VIRARSLEKRYGEKRILRGVTLDVAVDEFLLVTGPNGSGKTTLLRRREASSRLRSSVGASATSPTNRSSTAS